jgi:hypothetical protein
MFLHPGRAAQLLLVYTLPRMFFIEQLLLANQRWRKRGLVGEDFDWHRPREEEMVDCEAYFREELVQLGRLQCPSCNNATHDHPRRPGMDNL